ncbi:MAG: inositol monophosphatase [Dehalococcoidia bacterium]|nr:inositol monophosphatase [Dehalococcoidia bacterium]
MSLSDPAAVAPGATPDPALLERIEALAVALAQESGAVAAEALTREILVDYKPDAKGKEQDRDPVSEVDRAVEVAVQARVLAEFPGHLVLGEEGEAHPAPDAEWLWVVDPVDGTANFVNGFPLFAVSIGVLHHGRPVVGAVWCASTHALQAGVYHAHEGGPLRLDGVEVSHERRTRVRRTLAAAPGGSPAGTRLWDHRVTGSIAVEAAFVAAGIFVAAPFWGPKIWDIAGGLALVRASGREVWIRGRRGWEPFERFEAPRELPASVRKREGDRAPSLRDWRGSVLVGTTEATRAMREHSRRPSVWTRVLRRLAGRRP